MDYNEEQKNFIYSGYLWAAGFVVVILVGALAASTEQDTVLVILAGLVGLCAGIVGTIGHMQAQLLWAREVLECDKEVIDLAQRILAGKDDNER